MIFLGLGSNLGQKSANLCEALSRLEQKGIGVLRCSGFYASAAWGISDQAEFVNAVAELEFSGEAVDLLAHLLQVEREMGRRRLYKWGPRLIDLDIIEFQHQQIDQPGLTIPHPYFLQRGFVLVPLAELAPEWIPTGEKHDIEYWIDQLSAENLPRRLPGTFYP